LKTYFVLLDLIVDTNLSLDLIVDTNFVYRHIFQFWKYYFRKTLVFIYL